MMKTLLCSVVLTLGLTSGAAFADALRDALVNNTVKMTIGEATARFSLAADGTFTSDNGDTGTWTLEAGIFCANSADGRTACNPIPDGISVGSTWQGNEINGTAVNFVLE